MRTCWQRALAVAAALAMLAPAAARAQEKRPFRPGPPPRPFFPDFAGNVHEAFESKLVKGAPYKAESVTEITQTLADGNRIARKTTAAVYRDAEGRTRREMTLAAIGPLVAHEAPRLVFVHDPVAGTSFVLEPDTHTARKLGLPSRGAKGWGHGPGGAPGPDGAPGPGREPEGRFHGWAHGKGEDSWARQTENLGTQTIDGVEATGTRNTVTIPAGAIGNDRPIAIVSERWYSPELQVVVQSTHRDPRFGETTYRLTGITRGDQDKSLFEVPSDFTVREGPPEGAGFGHPPARNEKQ
jgi:hypothetical protein